MNQLKCNRNRHGSRTVKRCAAACREQEKCGTQTLSARGNKMFPDIRDERGIRDNGCRECRFKFLKICLYDIKHVAFQRRITCNGRICGAPPLSVICM